MFKALKWKYVFSDGVRNSEREGGQVITFLHYKKEPVIDSFYHIT